MLHPCTSVRFGALSALALLLAREMLFIGTQFTSTLLLASHANPQPELSSLIFEAKQLCDAARVLRYVHCSCVYVVASRHVSGMCQACVRLVGMSSLAVRPLSPHVSLSPAPLFVNLSPSLLYLQHSLVCACLRRPPTSLAFCHLLWCVLPSVAV